MIKNKTIYFGYGTIVVGGNIIRNTITFQEIEPPVEVGLRITKEIYETLKRGKTIQINEKFFNDDIMNALSGIEKLDNKQIRIDQYIFDFNNYNKKSIEVIRVKLEELRHWNQMCLAC